jgi:hypothetical protein
VFEVRIPTFSRTTRSGVVVVIQLSALEAKLWLPIILFLVPRAMISESKPHCIQSIDLTINEGNRRADAGYDG